MRCWNPGAFLDWEGSYPCFWMPCGIEDRLEKVRVLERVNQEIKRSGVDEY